MKGMGKAMMGTGEAEGEKRAEEATNAALNNPLIDEYSLEGAKGLLVNITGGSDLTTFEVDEAVNKIRAKVDPEAELIFGSIEDEKLNGKIRVSIVATSLDEQEPEKKPVVSMVHRLQNRNVGYSDNISNTLANNHSTLSATEGATALNLNNIIEENNITQQNVEKQTNKKEDNNPNLENISMESATYLQNVENVSESNDSNSNENVTNFEVDSIELATPQLFSESTETDLFNQSEDKNETTIFEKSSFNKDTVDDVKEPEMFEETNSEEELEIPAFLRRQKNN